MSVHRSLTEALADDRHRDRERERHRERHADRHPDHHHHRDRYRHRHRGGHPFAVRAPQPGVTASVRARLGWLFVGIGLRLALPGRETGAGRSAVPQR